MEHWNRGLGRGGAAWALAAIVGFAMWLALLPMIGRSAFLVGLGLALLTGIGVLRQPAPPRPRSRTPTRRVAPRRTQRA